MHKLNAEQARTFLMLHPEAYRVLYARLVGRITFDEAAALLCFDHDTMDLVADAAEAEARDVAAVAARK